MGRKRKESEQADKSAAAEPESKLIQSLSQKFAKRFGPEVVSAFGDNRAASEVQFGISSQSLMLDIALGRPGIPSGRIIELFGNESTGKTLLALHFLAEVQNIGGIAIFCDTERSVDWRFMKRVGLQFGDRGILIQPPNLEDSFTLLEEVILEVRKQYKKAPIAVAYDSIAGCPTKEELESDYTDNSPARVARFLSRGVKKLKDLISEKQVALIFTNQLRSKIAVYGKNEESFGGKALKFFASMRIEVSRKGVILGVDKQAKGIEIEAKVVKNKLGVPYNRARLALRFDRGLDKAADILSAAVLLEEITEKAGYYYFFGQDKRFSGKAFPMILKEKLGGWAAYREVLTTKAVEQGKIIPYGEMTAEESARSLPVEQQDELEGEECP